MQDNTRQDEIRNLFEGGKISGNISSFDDFLMEYYTPDEDEPESEDDDKDSHDGEKYYGSKKPTGRHGEEIADDDNSEDNEREMRESEMTSGFGSQSFYFSKNGDSCNYFFKIGEDDEHRCYVLTIGKFSQFGHPAQNKAQYGVFGLVELSEEVLDQSVLDKGQFETNDNKIEMSEKQLSTFLEQVSLCVADYLQKDPKCVTFFDEMQSTIEATDYDNLFAMSIDKWPGKRDTWKFSVIEKGKMNTITKQ